MKKLYVERERRGEERNRKEDNLFSPQRCPSIRPRRKIRILYRRPIDARETRLPDKQLLEQRPGLPQTSALGARYLPRRDTQRAVLICPKGARDASEIRPRRLIRRSAILPAIVNADRSRGP